MVTGFSIADYQFEDKINSCWMNVVIVIRGFLPLVLPCGPLRAIISLPSSRRHVIFGFGKPRALHINLAELPSGTIISPEVSS